MFDLTGKTVVITGASRGIGKAVAMSFASAGSTRLALLCRKNTGMLNGIAEEVRACGTEALPLIADVGDSKQVSDAFEKIIEKFGGVDILINNAGISVPGFVRNVSETDWDEPVRTNLTGVFNCSKAVIPVMLKNGGGHIIMISSITAVRGLFGEASYAASKSGVIALMQTIAKEYGRSNIRANCILPGFHLTGMTKNLPERVIERASSENVLGMTTDIGEVCAFILLLSRTLSISGQVFNLDGRIKREM